MCVVIKLAEDAIDDIHDIMQWLKSQPGDLACSESGIIQNSIERWMRTLGSREEAQQLNQPNLETCTDGSTPLPVQEVMELTALDLGEGSFSTIAATDSTDAITDSITTITATDAITDSANAIAAIDADSANAYTDSEEDEEIPAEKALNDLKCKSPTMTVNCHKIRKVIYGGKPVSQDGWSNIHNDPVIATSMTTDGGSGR